MDSTAGKVQSNTVLNEEFAAGIYVLKNIATEAYKSKKITIRQCAALTENLEYCRAQFIAQLKDNE